MSLLHIEANNTVENAAILLLIFRHLKNKVMKIKFKTRLEAIDWIAYYVEEEGTFEVLREQVLFNFIYTGQYFLESPEKVLEVATLDQSK